MLKFTYDQIVDKIKEEKKISNEEIDKLVNEKIKQLSDLISKEGAAHIVANQLGVKLFENISLEREMKVKEIPRGASNVSLVGKVLEIRDVVSFNKNGRSGKVVNFSVGDDTGSMRIVVWDEPIINEIEKGMFKVGDIIRMKNGYSRDNNGFVEVHLGSNSQLIVNPKDAKVGEVTMTKQKLGRKKIEDVKEGDYTEIFGTVVQLFEPRFFNVCKKCGKKVNEENGEFICREHGKTEHEKRGVMNFFFDDGSSNIRVVGFGEVINQLVSYTQDDIDNFSPALFDEWRKEALGKQVIVEGKVNKNEMFSRLEMVARKIREVDPTELLNEL
jgi:ssDNA-binding replication factor A large subunit